MARAHQTGRPSAPPSPDGGDAARSPEARWTLVQNALDHLDDGITVFDADLRLLAWNARFFDLVDVPMEGFARVGTPFEAFIRFNADRGEYGPGDPERQVAERVALARNATAHSLERERPNGRILEIRGNPTPDGGFITIYKDITEHRRAERALRESHDLLESRVEQRTAELKAVNARLMEEMAERKRAHEALREREEWIRLIADTVPAVIGYVDSDRRYRFANRRYQDWFGLTPDEIVGRRVEDVLGPALYSTHRDNVEAALAGRTVTWEFPAEIAGGREIQAVASFIPHVAEDGSVLGYVVLGQDVTEQRAADAALRQAQKMEAVGQLTGGLSHDFNNLLTIIIGNLAVLREQVGEDDTVTGLLDPALNAARRGAGLVKRLLAFARRQPLQPRVIDVSELVAGMTELLHRTIGVSVEVEMRLRDAPWPVLADPHQLENAVLNLAINARDAMPDGGRLRISCENVSLDAAAAARDPDAAPGDYAVICVTDTGVGMPADVRERAFEPFFTTKPGDGRSGLGLSMVYGFIRQSHGHVAIDSAPGRGTTVRLYLPRGPEAVAESEPAADTDVPMGSERVLVVEDDPDVRAFAVRALEELGYRVAAAAGGSEALRSLERGPAPELLLSDIEMPGGPGGFEVVHAARRRWPAARALLMSGYSDRALARGHAGLEDVPHLPKPFDKSELARAVRAALDGVPPA